MAENKKYLLREYYSLCDGGVCQDFLTESEKREMRDEGAMYLTGVCQKANYKNGNGRIYPKPVLEKAIEKYKRLIENRQSIGALDHPDSADVSLKDASHIITDVWWEGDDVMCKLKVLPTEQGNQLKNLVKDVQIGLSSRSLGSVTEKNGNIIVESDLEILCWDCVQSPSVDSAFMRLTEAKINVLNENKSYDKIHKLLDEILL